MRIAFVTAADPRDRRSWSGIFHGMLTALERAGHDVHAIGPLPSKRVPVGRALSKSLRVVAGRFYDWAHTPALATEYARGFEQRLAGERFDAIFAPAAATEIARLSTHLPIVYSSDATVALSKRYYLSETPIGWSQRSADSIERAAIQRAAALVYPTAWVANSALSDYGAEPAKVHVIPYGANLEDPPDAGRILRRRAGKQCRLLFLGVDWRRKGGEYALAALDTLRAWGIDARLTVCGCTPPAPVTTQGVRVMPFLDKSDPVQRRELDALFLESDFLLLPTRAEAYGIVFCEAAAYGLPVVATATGGVPGVVEHGVTGVLLPVDADGSAFAKEIAGIWHSPERYQQMVAAARLNYETRLNWEVWATRTSAVLEQVGARRVAPGSTPPYA